MFFKITFALVASFFFACWATGVVIAGEQKSVHLAVLDFASPSEASWIGPAVSSAIRAKLAGIKDINLLERERMQELLISANTRSGSPNLLGTDFLLTGDIQIVGPWDDEKSKIRVSAKIISADTAKVSGDTSFVLDGNSGKIFDLETDLARYFVNAVGKEPSDLQIQFREARSLKSKRLFAEGLCALQKSERLVGINMTELSAAIRQEAIPMLTEATELLRSAQLENEEHFYSQAHFCEGRAREILALIQVDAARSKEIRQATVEKFRADAAEAAPAFYDLGRALQANGEYTEAITAYDDYLKWMDQSKKSLQWKSDSYIDIGRPITSPLFNGPDVPNSTITDGLLLATDDKLICPSGRKLKAIAINDGKQIWEIETAESISVGLLAARNGKIAYLGQKNLHIWNEANGDNIMSIAIPNLPQLAELSKSIIYLPKKGVDCCVVYREIPVFEKSEVVCYLSSIKISEKRIVWHKNWIEPLIWHEEGRRISQKNLQRSKGTYYSSTSFIIYPQVVGGAAFFRNKLDGNVVYDCLDVESGEDASSRFNKDFVALKKFYYYYPQADGTGCLYSPIKTPAREKGIWGYKVNTLTEKPSPITEKWLYPRVINIKQDLSCRGFMTLGSRIEGEKGIFAYDRKIKAFRNIKTDILTNRPEVQFMPLEIHEDKMLCMTSGNEILLFDLKPKRKLLWRRFVDGKFKHTPILREDKIIVAVSKPSSYAYKIFVFRPVAENSAIKETAAWLGKADCLETIGKKKEALASLKTAIETGGSSSEIYYRLHKLSFEQKKGLESWCYADKFYSRAPASDKRCLEVWKNISEANGVIFRYAKYDMLPVGEALRILPDRKEVLICNTWGMDVTDLLHPEKTRRMKHSLSPCSSYKIITRNKNSVTVLQEREGQDKTYFVNYNLESGTTKIISKPSMDRIEMTGIWTSPGMRRLYDKMPQAFIDRNHPDKLLFVNPQDGETSFEVQLPEEASTIKHGFPSDRDISRVVAYTDRYIIAYSPKKHESWLRILCISKEDKNILWKTKITIGKTEKRFFVLQGWFHIKMMPCGNRVLISLMNKDCAFDVNTGEKADYKLDLYLQSSWIDSPYLPITQCQNPCFQVPLLKNKSFYRPLFFIRHKTIGGSHLWEGGPKLVSNPGTRKMIYFTKEELREMPAPISKSYPFPLYADGGIALFYVDEREDHYPKGGIAIYICKAESILRTMGWKGEFPEELQIDAPLAYQRSDSSPLIGKSK